MELGIRNEELGIRNAESGVRPVAAMVAAGQGQMMSEMGSCDYVFRMDGRAWDPWDRVRTPAN